MEGFVGWMTANWKEVIEAVLALLGAFSVIAKLTPTQVDDNVLAKVYSVIHFLGLSKKV